jgi:hypothetical protein
MHFRTCSSDTRVFGRTLRSYTRTDPVVRTNSTFLVLTHPTTHTHNTLDFRLRMQQNFFTSGDPLSLDRIRTILTRLEDTILFSLIERAQFAHNPKMYQKGVFPELKAAGFDGSWLEWFLTEIETFHGASYLLQRSASPPAHHASIQPRLGATRGMAYFTFNTITHT